MKTILQLMQDRGLSLDQLVEQSQLERRIVEAIMMGRYTPSPRQRQQLAAALDVPLEDVHWGHKTPVEHMYGHGPQFGRSP